jgi:PKD repeat protein
VNNITGSNFEVVRLDASPAADFDYALMEPTPLGAAAQADPTSGSPPLTVEFQGQGSGGSPPYSYKWDFGDGSAKKTGRNQSHAYSSAGTYNPVLKVTDSGGAVATDDSLSIVVSTPVSVTVSVTPASGDIPLTVDFSASASGGTPPYTYTWDFGDGTGGSGPNATHVYASAGYYHGTVSAQDSVGAASQDKEFTIHAIDPNALSVSAQADVNSGTVPLTVNFTGSASGGAPPYTYGWNFGDGGQSTDQNPAHTYTTVGTYHPVFTATDSTSAYTTDRLTIQVNPAESVPVIFQVKKKGSPFRLKILGSGFLPGCQVLIDGVPVPMVSYKSANKVMAKKGHPLKDMVPKGNTVCVTVRNPQGSESPCFSFTR